MTSGITEVPGMLIMGYGATGEVLFINSTNGNIVSTYSPAAVVEGETTVSNGVVYVPLANGTLIALGQTPSGFSAKAGCRLRPSKEKPCHQRAISTRASRMTSESSEGSRETRRLGERRHGPVSHMRPGRYRWLNRSDQGRLNPDLNIWDAGLADQPWLK